MAVHVYWIDGLWKGKLGIVPRPPGGDWLEAEISKWRDTGIDLVVSFLTSSEIKELDLEAEKKVAELQGIQYLSFAIPDREVPESKTAALTIVQDLKQSLIKGKNVALHCRQGIGRSAMMAAALLVSVGEEPAKAFERIGTARGGKVPDTTEQQQWVMDLEKKMPPKGERLFESYLLMQGITTYEYEKSYPGKSKSPDFSVMLDRKYIFEVKDFEPRDLLSSGAFNPYTQIRKKIDYAAKQFKEYKEYPCCLVLYNENARLVDLEFPGIMLGAMYGDESRIIEFNPELGIFDATTSKRTFHGNGKMIRPYWDKPQNTTISAIITLREVKVGARKLGVYLGQQMKEQELTSKQAFAKGFSSDIAFDKRERQVGVIVWENAFARIPFPRHLFRGPYDERWEATGDKIERGFVGSGIASLEDLESSDTLLLIP